MRSDKPSWDGVASGNDKKRPHLKLDDLSHYIVGPHLLTNSYELSHNTVKFTISS